MSAIFIEILNLSVMASYLISAILVLRFILKKAPKGIRYILWAMVGLRLSIPFSFESRLSLIPNAQSFDASIEKSTSYIQQTIVSNPAQSQSFNLLEILPYIWICGAVLMLLYMIVSYIRVRLMVRESVLYKDNIFLCDHVHSPFVLGTVNPKIYLSSSMKKRDMKLVTLHEQTHIKHKDNIIKPFGFLLLSVYWFNPLCWLGYFFFVKDIELFCDESVTKTLSKTARKKYSYALLGFSQRRITASACPLAFAENDVKTRVHNVLSYKKPAFYVVVISVMLCVVTMVLFMSSPVSAKVIQEYKFSKNLSQVVGEVEEIAETVPPTEAPTEKKVEKKPAKKKENKAEEPQQEYYDSSYNDNYSQNLYEVVPFYETEAYNKQFEISISDNKYTSYNANMDYGVQPYEEAIVWDLNGTDISNFN